MTVNDMIAELQDARDAGFGDVPCVTPAFGKLFTTTVTPYWWTTETGVKWTMASRPRCVRFDAGDQEVIQHEVR